MIKLQGIAFNETAMKNNTWRYTIEDSKSKKHYLISFNDYRIIMHYNIKVLYVIKPNKNTDYDDSKIIQNVKYLKITTNMKHIKHILYDIISLTSPTIRQIIEEFGEKSMEVIINEFDKISPMPTIDDFGSDTDNEDQIQISNEDYKKITEYRKCDSIHVLQNFFYEMDIKYNHKWYDKIMKHYELDSDFSIDKIKNKPYDLFFNCNLPFDIVDSIGLKLLSKYHPDRIQSIIKYIYKKLNSEGVLYLSKEKIVAYCEKKKIIIDDKLSKLLISSLKRITKKNKFYYTSHETYFMEKYVEMFCGKFMNNEIDVPNDYNREKLVETTMLQSEQLDAIDMIIKNNISIITGAPGTGKTYVIAHSCNQLEINIVLAPTGGAVQKLKYEIGRIFSDNKLDDNKHRRRPICKTINSFLCNEKNYDDIPINIFIDEMSMVSLSLFYKFLISLKKIKCMRLVLSGDKNQLPSIEGGNIFEDIINFSEFPCLELKKQHRTDKKIIISNAELILNGLDIQPDNDVVIFNESNTKEEIYDNLWKNLSNPKYKIRTDNSSILIPQRERGICSDYYNKRLQDYYNDKSEKICSNKKFDFRIGDKVINKKNDYQKEVYNGSILTTKNYIYKEIKKNNDKTLDILKFNNNKIVKHEKYTENKYRANQQFDHKLVCLFHENEKDLTKGEIRNYTKDELDMIELAYATTVHAAQGKGYDNVIIILHSSMYQPLLTRKMFYTAVTRSSKRCIIIGDKTSLNYCKKKDLPRVTNLFQNNTNDYDMIEFIVDNMCKYIDHSDVQNILIGIDINTNKMNYDCSVNDDEYKKLIKKLWENKNTLIKLFKLLENHIIVDYIGDKNKYVSKKNKLESIDET